MPTIKVTVSDSQGNVIDIIELELGENDTRLVLTLQPEIRQVPGNASDSIVIPPEVFE